MAATANLYADSGADSSSGSVRPSPGLSLPVAASMVIHASIFAAALVWWQGEGKSVQRGFPEGQSITFVSLVQAPAAAKTTSPTTTPEEPVVEPKPVEVRKVEAKVKPEPVEKKHAEAIKIKKKKPVEKHQVAQASQAQTSQTTKVSQSSESTSSSAASASPASSVAGAVPIGEANGSLGGDGEKAFFIEPQFRERPQPPAYPRRARRLAQEGEALIRVKLDPRGNAAEVLVWKSSGFALLDNAAITAVRHWKFVPAERSGKPVIAWVEIPVRFALN